MTNSLEYLKQTGTVVVSDSGDFETIDVYKPQDATTNPSLILAASNKPGYARARGDLDVQVNAAMDRLLIEFGKEILAIIPGRVSTEVDARLSFDKEATKGQGCFITLISPFVGRILDWYKKSTGKNYEGDEDPGVQSVKKIYNYYKQHVSEIKALAGVDFLTISPSLLEELKKSNDQVPKKLDAAAAAKDAPISKVSFIDNEPEFRWTLLEDQMAFDKLHEGIKKFAEDGVTLKNVLREKLSA
ncbi:hypothetical protein BDP27DRAFT_1386529 [Rhodocollybia butyracea]|uniref:Transaldolase n=1 Tax=Rhodocollybia butyracea TaxID=206335 RepID=A0A9P5TXQ1_9AGAR|nr:hypothetical protein BDP27DRAFT_1386529 [Rhodocollybia butyracea]